MISRKFFVEEHFRCNKLQIFPMYRTDFVDQDGKIESKTFDKKVPAYFAGMYYILFGN